MVRRYQPSQSIIADVFLAVLLTLSKRGEISTQVALGGEIGGTMNSEQHLATLHQQLAVHRTALRELWVQKATHEQAIAEIKATLQARGILCDISAYDGPGHPVPELPVPDEVRQFVERALGGPRAVAQWEW
jgi:hypothetical protein